MSAKEEDNSKGNGRESEELDYNEDKDQLEEEQEAGIGQRKEETTNQVF
jgi:hypothetical protein